MTAEYITKQKLSIRLSREAIAFATFNPTQERQLEYEPYINNSSISIAANLREAIKQIQLANGSFSRVQVMIDAPSLIVPVEEFQEDNADILFRHSFPNKQNEDIVCNVLPYLNAVSVFSVNKDLKLVLKDHYGALMPMTCVSPVWHHLHTRSFTSQYKKLYGYFHDKKLDIFSFNQNRFKFTNVYEAPHAHDAIYFLLYVWKQLNMDAEKDELHIVGDIPDRDWLTNELKKYLRNSFTINPSADFNRSPVTQVKMPYDMQTLLVCGR